MVRACALKYRNFLQAGHLLLTVYYQRLTKRTQGQRASSALLASDRRKARDLYAQGTAPLANEKLRLNDEVRRRGRDLQEAS